FVVVTVIWCILHPVEDRRPPPPPLFPYTTLFRSKTQINENAKMPAWWSTLPELDHNEIVGWETLPEMTREKFAVVALTDRDDHPRIRSRLDHTASLTSYAVPRAGEVASEGVSVRARLISLTVVGD